MAMGGGGVKQGWTSIFGKKSKYRIVWWRKDFIGEKSFDGEKILAKASKKMSNKLMHLLEDRSLS